MAIDLKSIKTGVSDDPPIITIWGDGGVGKTTFAANAPDPIFIFTEKSLGKLDVPRFTFLDADGQGTYIASTFEEVMESIEALFGEHDYKSIVIDSLDWLEPLVEKFLFKQRPFNEKGRAVSNIKDYGYGQGTTFLMEYWDEYFNLLKDLQKKKNMMVIQTAHKQSVKMSPPDSDSYSFWSLKLDNRAREKIIESTDALLFANTKTATTEEDIGFGQTRKRAIGSGDIFLLTQERAAHEGKNRYGLPYQIPVKERDWSDTWAILSQHIPWFRQFDDGAEPTKVAQKKPEPVVAKVEEKPAVVEEKKPETVVATTKPKFLQKG